jgi:hypothetical protein
MEAVLFDSHTCIISELPVAWRHHTMARAPAGHGTGKADYAVLQVGCDNPLS